MQVILRLPTHRSETIVICNGGKENHKKNKPVQKGSKNPQLFRKDGTKNKSYYSRKKIAGIEVGIPYARLLLFFGSLHVARQSDKTWVMLVNNNISSDYRTAPIREE